MKKLFLSSLAVTSIFALAYTQVDVDNASYLASKNIITTQSTTAGYRLDDTITRAEVVVIALKLRGAILPEGYACKRYFSDATKNDWICRAVEIAADAELVSRLNLKFRPQEKITRAEAFAIIYKASGVAPNREYGTFIIRDTDANVWQKDLFFKIHNTGISIPGEKMITTDNPSQPVYFYPNRPATRAEVFAFAKSILEYKATMSGQVTINNTTTKELKIENGNVVLYENNNRIKSLTSDAKRYATVPCDVGDTFISYSVIGQAGEISLVKKSFGLCDADGGSTYLILRNDWLYDFYGIVQEKFGLRPSGITSLKIINHMIVIQGYYYLNTCTDSMECSPGMTQEVINRLGIKIISPASSSNSGRYEWIIDSAQL